ncbi:DUF6153 family protein [Streptomyces sp. NBC_00878]|uniref:DUF6153 family protein n=1 Tax=Streptomyces sp. NBC_00878 TaxID=2975854 RepID=UPI00225B9483|nr:DUF6153 family protein [Streptomyces sp. NBC_00878]MCX4911124.1 DUF6153 family protein [Streptomyces sp. NBC_00878]
MASVCDEAVNRLGQLARPRSTSRFGGGLLLCALLLGLVGMHGLGPVPAGGAASSHGHGAMPTAAPMPAPMPAPMAAPMAAPLSVMASTPDSCEHGEGGSNGHAEHADPTCASVSVAGSPAVVPVLLPDVAARVGVPRAGTAPTGSGPDGGRAPPALSELQLLRI